MSTKSKWVLSGCFGCAVMSFIGFMAHNKEAGVVPALAAAAIFGGWLFLELMAAC